MEGFESALNVAIASGVFVVLAAAIPAIVSAYMASQTRRENSEQHAESQRVVRELKDAVEGQTSKLDAVDHNVKTVTKTVVDHLRWHAGDPVEDSSAGQDQA